MKRIIRVALASFAFLFGLGLLWLGITAFWLKGSLPRLEGQAIVEGLEAPVKIIRDKEGIPHIYAQSRDDALFGLGFVHGQDRLWQMEFQRRTVQGRLSEIAGSATLVADTYLRTLGLYRAAERSISHLSPEARKSFESYAAGVNASIPKGGQPLPPEFFMLGVKPEAWRPADSAAVLKAVAVQLSANAFQELLRLQLLGKLSVEKVRALNPPLPQGVIDAYEKYAPRERAKFAEAVDALSESALVLQPTGASNNWVVGGARTESGKPLLANDPHLPLTVPTFWYLAHLSWPGGDAIGGTVPGVPGIVAGRTRHIAWGLTTTGADTQDLYWEKLDPENPNFYMTPDGAKAFDMRREVIKVRLGSSKPVRILSSRHGPVLPTDEPRLKALVPDGFALSLRWPALDDDDRTGETLLRILDAKDASPGSVEHIFETYTAPIQSFVYADVQGNVGLILPGKIPVRKPTNAVYGLLPGDGSSAQFDWDGFLAGPDSPMWAGRENDVFVTANNNVVPPDYKPMIALDFDPEFRAQRIKELLEAGPTRHNVNSFKRIQLDDVERFAVDVLPDFISKVKAGSALESKALETLSAWNKRMNVEQAAPVIFAAWMRQITRDLFEDELGEMFKQMWSDRPMILAAVARGDQTASVLCDDVRTAGVRESCDGLVAQGFLKAVAELEDRFGDDVAKWRWGAAHRASFSHTPFGFIPVLSSLFGFKHEMGGGNSTIQRAAYRYSNSDPYAAVHGSGYRAIYDLGEDQKSLYMISTGQSGNIYSPYYANLAPRWARGEYLPMKLNADAIRHEAAAELVLQPSIPR